MAFYFPTVQFEIPSEGATIVSNANLLILKPATSLMSLTIELPTDPSDELVFTISCTQSITSVVLTTAKTIFGGVTTLLANSPQRWIYIDDQNSWFRV